MKTIAIGLAAMALLASGGCGDDEGARDTGPAGDASVSDTSTTDTGGAETTRTMKVRYVDKDDSPLEGVKLAVDTDQGRVEAVSDAAGEVVVEYRYLEDSTDVIAALEGYPILVRLDMAYEAPDTTDGFVVITMQPGPNPGDAARIVADATGVPPGGRWCVGIVSFFVPCQEEGAAWDQTVDVRQFEDTIQDYVYGYAFDDAGALYDFARADWMVAADGDRSLTLAFDGVLEETPVERDVTLNLPSDPESPFRTETLDESWQGWLIATEPGTYLPRSALTMVSVGTDTVTATMHYFPVMGDELIWAAAPTLNRADGVRSFRWFSAAAPEAPIDFLDLPRMRSGAVWTDEFEWTAPAADVDYYLVRLMNAAGVVAIALRTPNVFATVPAFPTGYDSSVSFPFPGAPGKAQVIATRGEGPPDDTASDPYRVDAEAARSVRRPITF